MSNFFSEFHTKHITDTDPSIHQSIHGNYQHFEMDQYHVGGVINYLDSGDSGQGIFTMVCGMMTPFQREIARSQAEINTTTYIKILSWFIQKSG